METNDITKMFEAVTKVFESRLNKQIAALIEQNTHKEDRYESEEIDQISAAFAEAQGEFPSIGLNRENPFFKSAYADYDALIRAVRPALKKNGLSVHHDTRPNNDGPTLIHTRLRHNSGQWFETRARIIPAKDDIQGYSSNMSYHKRYNVMNILGLSTSNDIDDDDGETDMIPVRNMKAKGTASKLKSKPHKPTETITPEQLEELQDILQDHPDIAEDMLDKLRLQSLADLPKEYYMGSIKRIREIIMAREGK